MFLLALASARRRSYLHALSIAPGRCVFARGNTLRQLVVSLLPQPGFLAKNQLPTQAPKWITVPGIAHLNPTEPERMLCPVRQLKLYIRDSERIRGARQRMFICWNRNIRDIMRSHLSRWIMETVKVAYTQADQQYDCVTAHEIRALSASWVYNCQVALPDFLAAAIWRSSGVFQNSYLRDMACVAEGMSTLSPVVVAQHVVNPGPCITNVFATCRKNFSQWHRSFQRKLRSHWLKFLRHVAITLVIQGPGHLHQPP